MKTAYCIIAVVILLSIISGCSNQDNNPISAQKNEEGLLKTLEEHEARLCILARQLAVTLNDKDITDLLKYKFETASSRESILNFSDLLSENVKGATFLQKITADSLKSKYNLKSILTEGEINELINSFDHGLDFYFPVMEHRQSWKSIINKVLVAYPPLSIDDSEWEKIIAFTLNGNKQLLSAKTPPTEPVLIISPCEHYGDHSIEKNNLLKKTHSTSSDEWRMTINHFYLYDANEPWPGGDAEIYVKIEDYDWIRTDCYTIDDEGYYYNYNKPLNPAWSFMPSGQRKFEIWEDDWTSGDDRVEQYWHWPDENDPATKYVEVGTTYKLWYYGAHNEADLYMGMELYID